MDIEKILIILFKVSIITCTLTFSLLEEQDVGTTIDISGALPRQEGVTLSLIPSSEYDLTQYFRFSNLATTITTIKRIDREMFCPYRTLCELELTFLSTPGLRVHTVALRVDDLNDSAPEFEVQTVRYRLAEDSPLATELDMPLARDRDSPANGVVSYELETSGGATIPFELRSNLLALTSPLDRETISHFSFNLIARDTGNRTGSVSVEIVVSDVNDNLPRFAASDRQVEITLPEDVNVGSVVLVVQAADADTDDVISYRMLTGGDTFSVDEVSGAVTLTGAGLDYERSRSHVISVLAYNVQPPTTVDNRSVAEIRVHVVDVNDNRPEVRVYPINHFRIAEDADEEVALSILIVTDRDSGHFGTFSCSILPLGAWFSLKPLDHDDTKSQQFLIIPNAPLDIDVPGTAANQRLEITCQDGGGLKSRSKYFTPEILDVNDNYPIFIGLLEETAATGYTCSVHENRIPDLPLLTVRARDDDVTPVNSHIRFRLIDHIDTRFEMDAESGEFRLKAKLDREQTPTIEVLVMASDTGEPSLSTSIAITITVEDVNDNAPSLLFASGQGYDEVTLLLPVPRYIAVYRLKSSDPDTDTTTPTYSITTPMCRIDTPTSPPPEFEVNTETGDIFLTVSPTMSRPKGGVSMGVYPATYCNLTAYVTDAAGNRGQGHLVVGFSRKHVTDTDVVVVSVVAVVCALVAIVLIVVAVLVVRKKRGCCFRRDQASKVNNNNDNGLHNIHVEYAYSSYNRDEDDVTDEISRQLHSTPKDNLSMDSGNGRSQEVDFNKSEINPPKEGVSTKSTRPRGHASSISDDLSKLVSQAFQLGRQRMARLAKDKPPPAVKRNNDDVIIETDGDVIPEQRSRAITSRSNYNNNDVVDTVVVTGDDVIAEVNGEIVYSNSLHSRV